MTPHVEGTVQIRAPAGSFVAAFVRRLEGGPFTGGSPRRDRYGVTRASDDALAFTALDALTARSVGLNDVDLAISPASVVHYRVTFWRWASYVVGLGGFIGVALIALFLAIDIRAYVARTPSAQLPGLSVDQNAGIAWGMAVFWGFVWPWILIGMHRSQVRRLIERVIGEVDETACSS